MSMNNLVSVIIPFSGRNDDVIELHRDYTEALDKIGSPYEIIYIVDGEFEAQFEQLTQLSNDDESIHVVKLAKTFGEASALNIGFDNSKGDLILTLPAYYQIEANELSKLFSEMEDNDMVIASRYPRIDSFSNRFMSKIFHKILTFISNSSFKDLGCGVRLFKRKIVDEITVYGEQHRFLPILATGRGFTVREVDLKQSTKEVFRRKYKIRTYISRLFDILTIIFLVRFTKKPLRFFGLIGSFMFACGGLLISYPIIERVFFSVALADRPIFVIAALMIVLGIQVLALGLIGELIIFTHGKNTKEYNIEKIIN